MKAWEVKVSCFAFYTYAKSIYYFYHHYEMFHSTNTESCVSGTRGGECDIQGSYTQDPCYQKPSRNTNMLLFFWWSRERLVPLTKIF